MQLKAKQLRKGNDTAVKNSDMWNFTAQLDALERHAKHGDAAACKKATGALIRRIAELKISLGKGGSRMPILERNERYEKARYALERVASYADEAAVRRQAFKAMHGDVVSMRMLRRSPNRDVREMADGRLPVRKSNSMDRDGLMKFSPSRTSGEKPGLRLAAWHYNP
jgi:hypothetical protein